MLAFLALTAMAQTPHDPWRTIRTEHYRVHYPESAAEWAVPMAEHLESIHTAVVEEVGYEPPGRIPIVVQDPMTTANGGAFPLVHAPRMMFWATPPEADSVLANYGRFDDVLSVHENAHLAHMLRRSRNPLVYVLDEWSGVGPITRKTPRWVVEGYATVVEARLTGYGRPHSDSRALFLRTLAREGRLPSYGELDGNPRWGGMGDAYLVGSAFLEWLEAKHGPGTLKGLWARLTAKRERSFDVAFTGLFGESAPILYARFSAELTAEAVAAEADRPEVNGERFADLSRTTSAPTLSDDGSELAAVFSNGAQHPQLRIWKTVVDEEAERTAQEANDKRQDRDPEDAPDRKPTTRPHEVVATRVHALRPPADPRFLPDGRVLFTSYTPDAHGRIRPDLYAWTPKRGDNRITRGEDLAAADPSPDGAFAIAVRKRFGATDLARVDLSNGEVTTFYDAPLHHVVDRPRVSVDGRVLWLENAGAGFVLRIAHGDGSSAEDLAIPEGFSVLDASFAPDGSILASLGRDGFVDVYRLLADGSVEQLTRSHNGTWAVEPGADALYVLAYDTDGLDIRRVVPDQPLAAVPPPSSVGAVAAGGAVFRVASPGPGTFADGPVEPHAYGFGPIEFRVLAGAATSKGGAGTSSVGVHLGDTIGRWEALFQRSYSYLAPSGSYGSFEWRGLPVDVRVGAFGMADLDHGRYGGELALESERRFATAQALVSLGGVLDRPFPGDPLDPRWFGYGALDFAWSEGRTGWLHAGGRGAMRYGRTGEDLARLVLIDSAVAAGPNGEVALGYSAGGSDGPSSLDRFVLGGPPTVAAPETWQWHRVTDPLIAPSGSTPLYDAMWASVNVSGAELFVRRYRTGSTALDPVGTTVAGARLAFGLDEQPIVRLPAVDLDVGLGCRLESPDTGVDPSPCDALSDYNLWSTITWTP